MEYAVKVSATGSGILETLKGINSDPSSWNMWMEVGKGDKDTSGVETPGSSQILLYQPVSRRKLDWVGYLDPDYLDLQHLMYSPDPTSKMYLVAKFPSHASPNDYIREMAIYIGGNCSLHTGTLLVMVNHSKIWWDSSAQLQREFVFTFQPSTPIVMATTSVETELIAVPPLDVQVEGDDIEIMPTQTLGDIDVIAVPPIGIEIEEDTLDLPTESASGAIT